MGRSIKIRTYCDIGKIETYIQFKNRDKACYHCKRRNTCAYSSLMSSIHIYDILRYSNMTIPKQIIVTKRDLNTDRVIELMHRIVEGIVGDVHGKQ